MAVVKDPNGDRTAELVRDAATKDANEIFQRLGTSLSGLSDEEAAERMEVFGPNEVAQERRHGWLERLWLASRNPLVILLTLLAIVSFATGDFRAGTVMVLMVGLGLSLRFIQETKADNAAA
jgi:Mg2+-importing ATPase